ncbi:MAG: 50S ribosomal protein L10 [Desulfobacterales bacterium]
MKLEKKKEIVKSLHEKFATSQVVIVTDCKGLDVASMNDLRRRLREFDVEFKVAKNSLLIRASEETDVHMIKECFKGPSAVALSYDDPIAPAKVLIKFAKDHENLEIKTGVMNGKVIDIDAIRAISALPSREILLGQFLSVINSVPAGFVQVLNAIPGRFLNLLQAVKEQKEAA